MGLCYSLRPLLFGDPGDDPGTASEPLGEDARPGAAPARPLTGTPPPPGGGQSPTRARPEEEQRSERRRRAEPVRAEEREAAREARKVSRGIDRMLREQKRDLQRTHRLLLLGRSLGAGAAGGPRGARTRQTRAE
jgi:guanine nucleotide-binding protein G(olf) subunit alpha